jgi:hypothetical protein
MLARPNHRIHLALGLAALWVASCTALRPEDELCPAGRGPIRGLPDPQVLASGENHPVALAVTGATLLWLDQGAPLQAAAEGSVVRLDYCTGNQQILARAQNRPSALALDATSRMLFWVNQGQTDGQGELWQVPIDGTERYATRLMMNEDHPTGVALDGTYVYWVNEGKRDSSGLSLPGGGSLRRMNLQDSRVETLAENLDAPSALVVAQGYVYVALAGTGAMVNIDPGGTEPITEVTFEVGSGSVIRVEAAPGRQPSTVTSAQNYPFALSFSGGQLYILNHGVLRSTGQVVVAGGLAGSGSVIADSLDFPTAMAVDSGTIYVAATGRFDEVAEGHLLMEETLTNVVTDVVGDQQLPRGIALDTHLVFWVNFGTLDTTDGDVRALFR